MDRNKIHCKELGSCVIPLYFPPATFPKQHRYHYFGKIIGRRENTSFVQYVDLFLKNSLCTVFSEHVSLTKQNTIALVISAHLCELDQYTDAQ